MKLLSAKNTIIAIQAVVIVVLGFLLIQGDDLTQMAGLEPVGGKSELEQVDSSQIVRVSRYGHVNYAKRIRDLQIGETGYTVPWAYNPEEGTLDIGYQIYNEPKGTAEMFVKRTNDGLHVRITDYEY